MPNFAIYDLFGFDHILYEGIVRQRSAKDGTDEKATFHLEGENLFHGRQGLGRKWNWYGDIFSHKNSNETGFHYVRKQDGRPGVTGPGSSMKIDTIHYAGPHQSRSTYISVSVGC